MQSTQTALLLIDVQQGFHDTRWGQRNNPAAEANIARLLEASRQARHSVIHIKHDSTNGHSPLAPGNPGNEFMPVARPLAGEAVFRKQVNSAFIGTKLELHLREQGIRRLIVVGLTTPHCVSTSVRMAANLGFDVRVVADACAAFSLQSHDGRLIPAGEVHYHALAALSGEFAEIVQCDDLVKTS